MSGSDKPAEDGLPHIDVRERAGHHTGNPQVLESRLFMQLLAFACEPGLAPDRAVAAIEAGLRERGLAGVVYADVNHPRGLALLTFSEDPTDFVTGVRSALMDDALAGLSPRPELSMFGRSYASGYEPDLKFWLLDRPRQNVLNEAWPWAVWYPLRRSGAFARLPGSEQAAILKEHALIGRAYGAQDLAHDVRLACHGLDANDNEFVVGLLGKDLHPLSHVVQSMRKTRQTSEYISQMGPFFVGQAIARVGTA
ncbi:MAG: chlorite dismutase family protein [Myxococcales bacterium]|nr:chlorite dismutase family protein [Myxococcales bacterium]MDD9964629.1 chlorite dismutase family protein [Myxococcales bacterium]